MGRIRVVVASDSIEHPAVTALGSMFETEHVSSIDALRARLEGSGVDCVVLGLELEDGDWLDALVAVEHVSATIPVVLCPERGAEALANDALAAGVADYVPAAEAPAALETRLERVVDSDPFEHSGPFRALAESATDAILAIDADGEIRFANDALQRVLGYAPAEVLGDPLTVLIPERLREAHRDGLRRYLQTGERALDWERIHLPGLHRNGDERSLEITFGEFDHEGSHFFVGILRDITEQERRRQQLERHTEQMEELISALSHDLRTPLNVAKGRIDLAQQAAENSKTVQDLDTAVDALDRMDTLITDLLDLAQQGLAVSEPELIELAQVVDAAWGMADTGDLELSRPDDLGAVEVDPTRLTELFQNLFSNTVVHATGATTVRVGRLSQAPGFYVADDGPGIPPAQRDRVFDAGFTTREEGTGFGLAIVRRIAEAHGWTVELRSSESGGARFEFRFD